MYLFRVGMYGYWVCWHIGVWVCGPVHAWMPLYEHGDGKMTPRGSPLTVWLQKLISLSFATGTFPH